MKRTLKQRIATLLWEARMKAPLEDFNGDTVCETMKRLVQREVRKREKEVMASVQRMARHWQ
jgi:hypothetical protein